MHILDEIDSTLNNFYCLEQPYIPNQSYDPCLLGDSYMLNIHHTSRNRKMTEVIEGLLPILKNRADGSVSCIAETEKVIYRNTSLVVLNLYAAWKCNRWLAYPAGSNWYSNKPRRYNEFHASRKLVLVMERLQEEGYVELANGFFDRVSGVGRYARAKATNKLIDLISPLSPNVIQSAAIRETIVLSQKWSIEDEDVTLKRPIDYEETEDTRSMRANLGRYNELIQQADINLVCPSDLKERIGSVPVWNNFTYRVFNDLFDIGGRFYGPWWITLRRVMVDGAKVKLRQYIRINGNPTVELDYSAQHPTLVYARKGLEPPDDPYEIEGHEREVVKQAVLYSLNAKTKAKTKAALNRWAWKERKETGLEDRYIIKPSLFDDIERKHAPIAEFFYSKAWTFLQRQDSEIAEKVMNHFTRKGIPVLMIHDSFIVEEEHEGELMEVMTQAMKQELDRYAPGLRVRIKRG